jgi:hypothetical protein
VAQSPDSFLLHRDQVDLRYIGAIEMSLQSPQIALPLCHEVRRKAEGSRFKSYISRPPGLIS